VSQKNLRFILFVAILHYLVGSYSGSMHNAVGAFTSLGDALNAAAGVDDSKTGSVTKEPMIVVESFSHKVINLPLSLVIEGSPRHGPKGVFYDFSMRVRVLNSLLAALIIFSLIQAISRLMYTQEQLSPSSEVGDRCAPFERIEAHLTDEKLLRIVLFPVLGKIGPWGMRRSLKSDMVFVYCVHSTASLGIEMILRVSQEMQKINGSSSQPVFLEFIRWILHAPLSVILGQKVLSQNELLIFLNSLICTFGVGAIRWWLNTANEPQR